MAEFPAFPLWTDAYLGDTRHLSTLEHGAYLLLLMTAWRTKEASLPDDDRILAKYAGLGPRQWAAMRPILEPFYRIQNGRWLQLRLIDERTRLESKKEIATANGRASALKRNNRHSTERDASDQQNGNKRPTPTPTTTPTPTPKVEKWEEEHVRAGAGESEIFELFPPQEVEFDQADVVRSAWNVMATQAGLPIATRLTEKRSNQLKERLKDYPFAEIIEAISRVPSMPFMTGDNDRGWRANFDYLIRPDSIAKINEGTYHNGNGKGRGSNPNLVLDLLRDARAYLDQNPGANGGGGGEEDCPNF